MVYNLAKVYVYSDDKNNLKPERKTHKEQSGATSTLKIITSVAEVIKENLSKNYQKSPRKWALVGEQSGGVLPYKIIFVPYICASI